MKKVFLILIATILMAAPAFAACNTDSGVSGDSFVVDDNATPAETLTFNVSPGVIACHYSETGTAEASQWYAIAAVNEGGNTAYATASSFTSVYKKDVSNLAVKTSAAVFDAYLATQASVDAWTDWSN